MTAYKDDTERDAQFDDLDADETYADVMDDVSSEAAYDAETIGDVEGDILSDDLDESWEDKDQVEDEARIQPRKKSHAVLYLVIGVVVLAGVGFAVLKMSSASKGEFAIEGQAEVNSASGSLQSLRPEGEQIPVAPEPTVSVKAPESSSQGFMNEMPSDTSAPQAVPAEGSAPLAVAPNTTISQTPSTPPLTSSADTSFAAAPQEAPPVVSEGTTAQPVVVLGGLKPVSDFPTVDQIKKAPAVDELQGTATSAQDMPVVAANLPVAKDNSAQLAAVQARLDTALAQVSTLEKDLEAARTAEKTAAEKAELLVATNASAQTSQAEAAQKTSQARIKELEKQVAGLQKQINDQSADPSSVSTPAPTQTIKSPNVSDTETAPVIAKPKVAITAPKPVIWELRSAQPGQAMLSRKNSSDIRNVSVGDNVPGLGRITAVESTSSGWIVRGTAGQVKQ